LDELSSLTPDGRRRVARAVSQGAALSDPKEARAAVALARQVQQRTPRSQPWTRRRLTFTGATAVVAAIFAGVVSKQVLMGLAAPLVVVGVVLLNEGLNARRVTLAAAAERRNAAAAAGGAGGAQPSEP
jgi:hypothetical protein